MQNYKIMFPQGCGKFKQGDVATEAHLGDVAYLLRVGAIEATDDPETEVDGSPTIAEVVKKGPSDKEKKLEAEVKSLKQEIEDLKSKLAASEASEEIEKAEEVEEVEEIEEVEEVEETEPAKTSKAKK